VKCSYCTKDWHTQEKCQKRKRDELLAKSRQDYAAVAVTPPIQNSSRKLARSNNEASGSKQDHSYISNFTCSRFSVLKIGLLIQARHNTWPINESFSRVFHS
jgi:hypothetical protein